MKTVTMVIFWLVVSVSSVFSQTTPITITDEIIEVINESASRADVLDQTPVLKMYGRVLIPDEKYLYEELAKFKCDDKILEFIEKYPLQTTKFMRFVVLLDINTVTGGVKDAHMYYVAAHLKNEGLLMSTDVISLMQNQVDQEIQEVFLTAMPEYVAWKELQAGGLKRYTEALFQTLCNNKEVKSVFTINKTQ
jgi:hypothetical protein